MATLTIKASTVIIPEKRAAEICGLLGELGVEFTFAPTRNPNPKPDELLKDVTASVRMLRVARCACEQKGLDWNTVTVKQFSDTIGRSDLIKMPNCGKRSIEEIKEMLHEHGFLMMI